MKVIEVVMLMGAHCVSPVETTAATTEAVKVQCAVVIERDVSAGTVRIVPAGASTKPEVAAVLERLDTPPAAAPVAEPPPMTAPATETRDAEATPPALAEPAPTAKPVKPATAAKAKPRQEQPKPKTPATATKADPKSQCRGTAKPKWYKAADGRRKYRCVTAG